MPDRALKDSATRALGRSMYSPLSAIIRREPVWCPPSTRLGDTLATMRQLRIGSMVVADPASQAPLGIFTLQDLLGRVALEERDLAQPIERVMTSPVVTLEPQVSAYQAAVTMTRYGLRHVVVVEQGRLVGVVSQKDLFNLQRTGTVEIGTAIQAAGDLDALKRAARDIRELTKSMLDQGVGAEPLTQVISALNDLLTIRIIEIVQARHTLPDVKLCWQIGRAHV